MAAPLLLGTRMTRTALLIAAGLVFAACSPAEQPPEESSNAIDLIVPGEYVVTMDEALTVIEDGAVAVDQGVIIEVGPATEIESRYAARKTLPRDNRVVMPGSS